MATIDDLLTTQKNGVVALNNLGVTLKSYNEGQYTSATVSSSTLITTGSGRLVNVIIVNAGSTTGYVYNSSTTAGVLATNAIVPLPPSAVGVYPVGTRFTAGLVIVPGTGQQVNITYSLDS